MNLFFSGKINYYTAVNVLGGTSTHLERFTTETINCRSTNEIKNLQYLPRTSEPREMLFEDRTRAHADHIGQGFERQTTAAVGVLKAVRCGEE